MLSPLSQYKVAFGVMLIGLPLLYMLFWALKQPFEESFRQVLYQEAGETLAQHIEDKIAKKQQATLMLAVSLAEQMRSHDKAFEARVAGFVSNNLQPMVAGLSAQTDYKNLWLQISDRHGKVLYRSWDMRCDNVQDIRPELVWLKKHPGPLKTVSTCSHTLAIRAIAPIYNATGVAGFIEVASHFNSIQKALTLENIGSLAVASRQRSALITHPVGQHWLHGHYVANFEPEPLLLGRISHRDISNWFSTTQPHLVWRDQLLVLYPLKSVDGTLQGLFLAFKPLAEVESVGVVENLIQQRYQLHLLGETAALLLLFGGLLWIVLQQKHYYRTIIDQENEIVFVSSGNRIIEANKAFFRYFKRYDDLAAFQQDYTCICELFVEEEGYLQKRMGVTSWLDYLLSHPDAEQKVKIHFGAEPSIFAIRASYIDTQKGLCVVVMNDITDSERLTQTLLEIATTDALTGIGNRRRFNDVYKKQWLSAQRYQTPLFLLILDIDHFKVVNDTYGHDVGDEVLKKLAETLQSHLRESDEFFRIGGEEFAVLLSHQTEEQALAVAEKLRSEVQNTAFPQIDHLTISIGLSQFTGQSENELFKQADNALYEAKNSGRNCVRMAKEAAKGVLNPV